jgi:hypothetical protein
MGGGALFLHRITEWSAVASRVATQVSQGRAVLAKPARKATATIRRETAKRLEFIPHLLKLSVSK